MILLQEQPEADAAAATSENPYSSLPAIGHHYVYSQLSIFSLPN